MSGLTTSLVLELYNDLPDTARKALGGTTLAIVDAAIALVGYAPCAVYHRIDWLDMTVEWRNKSEWWDVSSEGVVSKFGQERLKR